MVFYDLYDLHGLDRRLSEVYKHQRYTLSPAVEVDRRNLLRSYPTVGVAASVPELLT